MNQGETKHLGKPMFYRKTITAVQEFDKSDCAYSYTLWPQIKLYTQGQFCDAVTP